MLCAPDRAHHLFVIASRLFSLPCFLRKNFNLKGPERAHDRALMSDEPRGVPLALPPGGVGVCA